MFALKDVLIKQSAPTTLLLEKHIAFIQSYESKKNDYEYVMSEYLRMSGVYWCLTAMDIVNELDRLNKSDIIDFVMNSFDEKSGGFGASIGYDPHVLHTLSAVQILTMYKAVDRLDKEKVVRFLTNLQQEDGSFVGDEWGEVDSRFSFCAIACLALLGHLDAIDVDKAVDYVLRCQNFDGGFGTRPGSESHAGQIYCCLGVLSITRELHRIDVDQLGWWLCERQCPSGGLNGRPEKLPDVCYSWWVLTSLAIIGKLHWVDKTALIKFIYACQDEETGGFADHPGNMPDPFHTVFGLAGLSLVGEKRLKNVNPVFCMPDDLVESLNIHLQLL